jgi:hypothetical protein
MRVLDKYRNIDRMLLGEFIESRIVGKGNSNGGFDNSVDE